MIMRINMKEVLSFLIAKSSLRPLRLYLRFYGVINFEIIPLEFMILGGAYEPGF